MRQGRDLRLVSYVYGEKLKQANGRCIAYPGELEKLGRDVRRVRLLRRRGLHRLPLEPPRAGELHGRLHAS